MEILQTFSYELDINATETWWDDSSDWNIVIKETEALRRVTDCMLSNQFLLSCLNEFI